MQHSSGWHVNQDATDDEAYAILSQDPVWNCFALADLQAPLRQYSQFPIAYREGRNEHAICLVLCHPSIGQVLSPCGAEAGVAAILNVFADNDDAIRIYQRLGFQMRLRFLTGRATIK
jgi:hypothetical protein